MRVAVLGSGLTGTLAALELAEAGFEVSLFDRKDQPFSGASLSCEGKIHLGYVYALDRSRRTALTMLRGTAVFQRLIERWTGAGFFEEALSEPFSYAVPRDSLLTVEDVRAHFRAVSDAIAEFEPSLLMPSDMQQCRELAPEDYDHIFDPESVAAVFQTKERAIDTAVLAGVLRAALDASPQIEQRMGCHISAVTLNGAGYDVQGADAGHAFSEGFDVVVNSLWEHRLLIDETFGLPVDRPVVHRFKYGAFARRTEMLKAIPSVTFISGSFGDTVAFSENAYLSWYPAGLVSQEVAICPRCQDFQLTADANERIISDTMRNLRRLMPGISHVLTDDPEAWTLKGGFVTAWGCSGIEDPGSQLHERYEVGVFSRDDYHSVDTGKLTLAPLFASEVCKRILARHGAARR